MKIKEYNQMLGYLTRPSKSIDPTQVEKDLSQKQLEKYATQPNSTGAYKSFIKQKKKEKKTDEEIDNFSKEFQPHKKTIPQQKKGLDNLTDEWVLHIAAMYGRDESPKYKEHLIEDVQVKPNGELRGMITDNLYNAIEAIKMNEKYDRNFTNPELGKEKSTYLTANERVLANYNPTEALKYTDGGRDQENIKYMRYVKSKARRIKNASKNKRADNPKLFESIIDNLGKKKPKKIKTALLTDEQKKDPKIIEVPFGPSFKEEIEKMEKEKESKDEAYQIKLPRDPVEMKFASLLLQNELQKENDVQSGIGAFDNRVRFASGANGSTPKTPQTFQRQIEDLYGVRLIGQETIAELLETVKELNEKN
jgi:hypothetical protein